MLSKGGLEVGDFWGFYRVDVVADLYFGCNYLVF